MHAMNRLYFKTHLAEKEYQDFEYFRKKLIDEFFMMTLIVVNSTIFQTQLVIFILDF